MKIYKIFGAPGTGKTTWMTKRLQQRLDAGADPEQIFAISFTRAAKTSLLEKMPALTDRNVRTLHSFAFESLSLRYNNILKFNDIKRFFASIGYEYSWQNDKDIFAIPRIAVGNLLEACWGYYANILPSFQTDFGAMQEALQKTEIDFLTNTRSLGLYNNFRRFQASKQKFTYTEILHQAYEKNIYLSGDILVIDEAQDLTPLMYMILQPNFKNFNEVYLLGDDDQCIYGYSGADPKILLNIKADEEIVLNKTWRLPAPILRLSQAYIEKNETRKSKVFQPVKENGTIEVKWDLFTLVHNVVQKNEETLILCRHKKTVAKIASWLDVMGKEYYVLGKAEKQNEQNQTLTKEMQKICKVIYCLQHTEYGFIPLRSELEEFFKKVDAKKLNKRKQEYFKAIEKSHNNFFVFTLASLWQKNKFNLFLENHKDFIEANFNIYKPEEKQELIRIGTIHTAKGLEAKNVILSLEANSRVISQLTTEEERRVWYVGMTRSKENLYLQKADVLEIQHLLNTL